MSLKDINTASNLSPKGVSFADLIKGAEAIGFRALPIQCTVSELIHEIPLPAIAHWKDNHFVVVYHVVKPTNLKGDLIIHVSDPAKGLVTYPAEVFRKNWLGQYTKPEKGAILLIEPLK